MKDGATYITYMIRGEEVNQCIWTHEITYIPEDGGDTAYLGEVVKTVISPAPEKNNAAFKAKIYLKESHFSSLEYVPTTDADFDRGVFTYEAMALVCDKDFSEGVFDKEAFRKRLWVDQIQREEKRSGRKFPDWMVVHLALGKKVTSPERSKAWFDTMVRQYHEEKEEV